MYMYLCICPFSVSLLYFFSFSLPSLLHVSLHTLSLSLFHSFSLQGCTVMHVSAHEGFKVGVEHILTLRPESVHDTDKMVTIYWHYNMYMYMFMCTYT